MGFKAGDRVRVRDYEDMAEEYGVNAGGVIKHIRFLPEMTVMCGETADVVKVDSLQVFLGNWSKDPKQTWAYLPEMLEAVEETKEEPALTEVCTCEEGSLAISMDCPSHAHLLVGYIQEGVKTDNYWDNLTQAASIAEDRQEDYGDVKENFTEIKNIADAMFGLNLTEEQICQLFIAMKVARQKNKHKEDNLLDAINYFSILLHLKK